ncbi:MAG: S26 family signal peptidase [Treponema sp.]|jgi:signal peptidase I|nr:S26 family signal peptidase [Treponema sp.]
MRGIVLGEIVASGRKKVSPERAILLALIAALLIKIFVLDFMIADGYSMSPAIRPGAVLFVCRVFYGIRLPSTGEYLIKWRMPRIGEVVVFYTPMGDVAVKRLGRILPGGMFYALGDNAPQSYDSRNYGPVPKRNIIGRVLGVR